MRFQLVTAADPIVDVRDAKAHLNVEHDDDDQLIKRLIAAATQFLEKRAVRQFGAATWNLYLDSFPWSSGIAGQNGAIEIRKVPVSAVTEIAYTDSNGDAQTLADFQLDAISEPARIFPAFGASWPATAAVPNAVVVTFTAGQADVSEEAVQAALLLVGYWYANRETVAIGVASKPLEFAVDALIASMKWGL